ncbi:MAG: C-GCAxxG-C-C family protein [Lachnospiraceae bacterium]|nr:C-GCAxxG-C-C family protein [Lachnospiraceae bacterium]
MTVTFEERAKKAVELKIFGGYNCTQAVTAALADETNLTEEQLKNLSAGFCAGMGNLEATCGALIGAVMVAGMKTEGKGTLKIARQMQETFKERCGALKCRDLKTVTDGKPLCPCEECVRNAVMIYGELLSEKSPGSER